MEKGKLAEKGGLALMIFGLVFMVVAYIQIDNLNYVMAGLVVVSIGSFLNRFGRKQLQRK